jgi:uncharacterized membrane protein YhaH (DUF805 family)
MTMIHRRVHATMRPTWADLLALITAIGAAMLPEFLGIHADTWAELVAPSHLIPALLPALAVIGAWANKFRAQ